MKGKNSTVKNFSALTLLTIFEKIIAFIFEATIAAKLGTSLVTDAYFSGAELFTLVDATLFSSLTVIVINRFAHHENRDGNQQAFSHVSNILSVYFPLAVILSILFFVFARPLSYIAAPGYDIDARNILIRCIRVMSVVPITGCFTAIYLAILRQKRQFVITGLKSLYISVVGIAALFLFGNKEIINADILSIPFILSMVLYFVTTGIFTSRYGKLQIHIPRFDSEVKRSLRMVLPLMVSSGIASVALMVDKMIASILGEGNVSALTYAHSLYKVVITIFVMNISTIVLTDFNELYAQKKSDELINKIRKVIILMTELLLPITIITVFCTDDITRIVYERGNFGSSSTMIVSNVLLFYSLNFIPAMIQGIYNQVMYAEGDTKKPMYISLISIVINFAVSLPLVYVVGLAGVAVGTLISTIVSVILSYIVVKKQFSEYKSCYEFPILVKLFISSISCALIVYIIKQLNFPVIIRFTFATIAGFFVFGIVLFFVHEKNFINSTQKLIKKFDHKS